MGLPALTASRRAKAVQMLKDSESRQMRMTAVEQCQSRLAKAERQRLLQQS